MNAARIISFYGYDWMSSILPWQPLEVKFRFQNVSFNFISQMVLWMEISWNGKQCGVF